MFTLGSCKSRDSFVTLGDGDFDSVIHEKYSK